MLESDVFDEESFAEGVLGFDQFDVVEPVVGKFRGLVDDGGIGVPQGKFGLDGGGRVVVFCESEQGSRDEQVTENQSNNLFH